MHPNDDLIEVTKILESEFNKMHGNSLSDEKQLFTTLCNRTILKLNNNLRQSVPNEVVLCLARTRTYIRLRDINRKISLENCRRKLDRKLSKFTNYKK